MIKKFSSPKIKIWFPPKAGRRADVFILTQFLRPREESNLYHKLRKLASCPLNDEGSRLYCMRFCLVCPLELFARKVPRLIGSLISLSL